MFIIVELGSGQDVFLSSCSKSNLFMPTRQQEKVGVWVYPFLAYVYYVLSVLLCVYFYNSIQNTCRL